MKLSQASTLEEAVAVIQGGKSSDGIKPDDVKIDLETTIGKESTAASIVEAISENSLGDVDWLELFDPDVTPPPRYQTDRVDEYLVQCKTEKVSIFVAYHNGCMISADGLFAASPISRSGQ